MTIHFTDKAISEVKHSKKEFISWGMSNEDQPFNRDKQENTMKKKF